MPWKMNPCPKCGEPKARQSQMCRRCRNSVPMIERLFKHVDKSGDCWVWTASRLPSGYGTFGRGGKYGGVMLAHRASWALHNSPIPTGMQVLHKCDNPSCVRPDHLFLGTQEENLLDARAKGRLTIGGENHATSKLTTGDVRQIRELLSSTQFKQSEIASRFGVTQTTISAISTGRYWKEQAQ